MAKAENLPVFLKSVTIQGFKSFADRVKIELQRGLCVIVGPNGSGKSNVADAVRWALGEQSARSLRGTKMEDIIFAGSTGRRPVGMAEVSLTFDNAAGIFPLDFQEVTITRRVYRDGEGQFLINRSPCRLKDIQELFLDTGAGKEGFSIIGQGRVEEILNAKPEERRYLLEEATGISKYRLRKREALKRLDDTEQNSQRLSDILREIEGQLAPLAEQARVAEHSFALQAEGRQLEIELIVKDLLGIRGRLASAGEEEGTLRQRYATLLGELSTADSLNEEEKFKEKRLEEEIQEQQNLVYQGEQALNALLNELNILREREIFAQEQIKRLEEETSSGREKQNFLKERIKTIENRETLLKHTVLEARKEFTAQEEELRRVRENNKLEEVERVKSELFAALSEQAGSSNELTGVRHTLGALDQQFSQLERDKQAKEAQRGTLQADLAERLGQIEDLDRHCREILDREPELENRHALLGQESQGLARILEELKGKSERLRAKSQALRNLEESLEGYARGVREVLTAKKRGVSACQGLCGTVADLLKVEEKYEIALEIALGGGLQYIVAETLADAKQGIAYLKAQKTGWATFLPLDTVQGGRLATDKYARDPGYIGLAVELAGFEERYRPALENLLGRVVIAKDMEAATRIAQLGNYRVRVVTLEGDQIHPGGTLTGGSIQRKGANLLGRSREIEELKRELENLERRRGESLGKYQELEQKRQKTELALKEAREARSSLQEERKILQINRENLQSQISRLQEDLNLIIMRQAEASEQQAEARQRLEAIRDEAEKNDRLVAALRVSLQQREAEAQAAAGEIERIAESLTEARVRLAKWEQELSQSMDLLEQERANWREQEKALKDKLARLEELLVNSANIQRDISAAQEAQAKAKESQAAKQLKLAETRQGRESVSARVLEGDKLAGKLRRDIAALEQRLHANELNLARWQAEWEGGATRLAQEFSLTWEEAAPFNRAESKREDVWQRIQAFKLELAELGPINQAAVTEYPKLLQRQDFLLAQQEDLVQADQKLRSLIAELDQTMSKRFSEGFNLINKAFQEVFQELFNGGQAELRLLEPEQLLETGVEIVAQPPGKKQQWLSLLSGGERALTAIALLFALLKVKPSPFCLLDEIEASLDDANVKRFAEYLKRLSPFTQFIVISHRKGSMEAADVLFGIAMEESGVSKLLTVQLDDAQEAG